MSGFARKATELQQQFLDRGGFSSLSRVAGAMPGRGLFGRHFDEVAKVVNDFKASTHFAISHDTICGSPKAPIGQRVFANLSNYMRPVPDHGDEAFASSSVATLAGQHMLVHLERRHPVMFGNMDYVQHRHIVEMGTPFDCKADQFDRVVSVGMNLSQALSKKWQEFGNPDGGFEPVVVPSKGGMFVGTAHLVEPNEFDYEPGSFVARNVQVQLGHAAVMKFQKDKHPAVHEKPQAAIVLRNFVSVSGMTGVERAVYGMVRPFYEDPNYTGSELCRFQDYIYNQHIPHIRHAVPTYMRGIRDVATIDAQSLSLIHI